MIVSVGEIRDFFGDLDESLYDIISSIHLGVEQFVKTYCNRDFESTSYTLEEYSGTGGQFLFLNNFPITAVDRIAIGTIDVIKIKNTNSSSNASVSVTSTGLRLVYNNTANATILFASYTTLTLLVAAINALGSGWSAELLHSMYSSYKSTELIKKWGMNALDNNWVYLNIPDKALENFSVNENSGIISRALGFPSGFNNIRVSYTSGYSSTNMPNDLKEAVKQFIQYIYNKRDEESFGLTQYRIGTNSVLSIFEEDPIPKEIKQVFSFYKKSKV